MKDSIETLWDASSWSSKTEDTSMTLWDFLTWKKILSDEFRRSSFNALFCEREFKEHRFLKIPSTENWDNQSKNNQQSASCPKKERKRPRMSYQCSLFSLYYIIEKYWKSPPSSCLNQFLESILVISNASSLLFCFMEKIIIICYKAMNTVPVGTVFEIMFSVL